MMMLILIACLLSQFERADIPELSVDDYQAACEAEKLAVVARRKRTEVIAPSKKAKFSDAKRITARNKSRLAEIEAFAADPTNIVHPSLPPDAFKVGAFGVLQYKYEWPRPSVQVLQILDDHTLLCKVNTVFVLRGFDTSKIVDNQRLTTDQVLIVSGRFSYVNALNVKQTVFALEPWSGSDEFNKRIEKLKMKPEETKKPATANPAPKATEDKPK